MHDLEVEIKLVIACKRNDVVKIDMSHQNAPELFDLEVLEVYVVLLGDPKELVAKNRHIVLDKFGKIMWSIEVSDNLRHARITVS